MDERVTVSVERVDERTVRLTTDEGSEDFEVHPDCLEITVESLRGQEGLGPRPYRKIFGTGICPPIAVIGAPATTATSIRVSLVAATTAENEASLSFMWEAHQWPLWFVQLQIPQSIFDSLWIEGKAGTVDSLSVRVLFVNLYGSKSRDWHDWFLCPAYPEKKFDSFSFGEHATGHVQYLFYQTFPKTTSSAVHLSKQGVDGPHDLAAEELSERRHQEIVKALYDLSQSVQQTSPQGRGAAGADKAAEKSHHEILQTLEQVGLSIQNLRKTARNVGWVIAVAALMQACSAMLELGSK